MRRLSRTLASLKLTLAGLAGLLVNAVAITQWPTLAISWLVLPLGVLAINLAAAVLVRQAFRHQAALFLFHAGLLGIVVIAGAGVLVRFDGQVEIVEGADFSPSAVTVRNTGWLHAGNLDAVRFRQGPVSVDYIDGLRRDRTQSRVSVPSEVEGESRLDIGDRFGFTVGGYRFMTTPNKGFALLLEWQDDEDATIGAINFPSFPEFEWKQINSWATPAGETLALELVLAERVPTRGPWRLSSGNTDYTLLIRDPAGREYELREGESLAVAGGRIRVLDLRLWMGYRIDYDPLLPWLLAAAFLTLIAMALHFADKYRGATDTARALLVERGQTA